MKVCNKCKCKKTFDDFYKDKSIKDGFERECKLCKKQRSKIYYKKNKEKILEKTKKAAIGTDYVKKWRENNRKYPNIYYQNRIKEDKIFKFSCNIRCLIRGSFKRGTNQFKKSAKSETILGCTIKEFKKYIEDKFIEGMSFENHGEWHLDHIIPLSSVNTEEEVIKLNHYTNFQPLWSKDNLKKGNKIDG